MVNHLKLHKYMGFWNLLKLYFSGVGDSKVVRFYPVFVLKGSASE